MIAQSNGGKLPGRERQRRAKRLRQFERHTISLSLYVLSLLPPDSSSDLGQEGVGKEFDRNEYIAKERHPPQRTNISCP